MATKNSGGAARALPPITVNKMRDAAQLMERRVLEDTSIFSQRIREYRAARATGSERGLTPDEAVQLTSGVIPALVEAGNTEAAENPEALAVKFQNSDLKARDVVPQSEVLLAAGLATAPALLETVSQLVALIEMPAVRYKKAKAEDTLDDAIREDAEAFGDLDLADGRARAAAALEHFQKAAGATAGEAVGLLRDMIGQAIAQATEIDLSEISPFSSLTGSPPPMGGPET